MNDAERRKLFQAWFEGPPLRGDREALIQRTGYTKGRVSQFFNEEEQFGERAARSLAKRLKLDEEFFNTPSIATSNVKFSGVDLNELTGSEVTLGTALATLAHQLQNADDISREQAGLLLKRLASEPERAEEIATRLAATLSTGHEASAHRTDITPITQTPGFLPKK